MILFSVSKRKQFVYINSLDSNIEIINCGVTQGSALRLQMFLVCVRPNYIANCVHNIPKKLYEDDKIITVCLS